MSLFITFEGAEGSGKSTQSLRLQKWLEEQGIATVLTHEPGGTVLGEKISDLLKWAQETKLTPLTELMLFNSSRSQLVSEVIKPALKAGKTVICDRFFDSTTAYQSYGRGLDLNMVMNVNLTAAGGMVPDLTILLDIPVEDGFERKSGDKLDRFELEDIEFHREVREGYLKLAEEEPERWLVIDAGQPADKITEIIQSKIKSML